MDRIYLHLVWTTWRRLPLVTADRERPIAGAVTATASELGAEVLEFGAMPDHVHVVIRVAPAVPIAELVRRLKGASSHLITREHGADGFFKWQKGYGVFSISRWDVERIRGYVRRQKDHHSSGHLSRHLERMVED